MSRIRSRLDIRGIVVPLMLNRQSLSVARYLITMVDVFDSLLGSHTFEDAGLRFCTLCFQLGIAGKHVALHSFTRLAIV